LEEGFKGLKRNQPSLDKFVTNCLGQIPWTYSGQWIDMEGTDEKCGNKDL